jgi:hypothetical protein
MRFLISLALLTLLLPWRTCAQNSAHFCDIKAAMHDEYLETAGVRAANKKAAQMGCREVYKVAKIVSPEWELFYENDLLVGRKIHMEVYGETWEGQCGVTHFIFKQKYLGHHEWGNMRCDYMGDFYDMDCESGYDVGDGKYYGRE